MPDGYTTEVGERGLKLSGTKGGALPSHEYCSRNQQSIFLMKQLQQSIRTPNEKFKMLDEISVGATTLSSAHRLSTVVNADMIIVLDHGVMAERGSNEGLLEKNGLYSKLWQQQVQESL